MKPTSGTFSSFVGLPEERAALRHLARVRWGLLVAALLLSLVGLATVHSASSEMGIDYLPRQALWVALGMVVFVVTFSIDHQTLTKFAWLIYLLGVAMLVLVLFVGQEAGGSRSWLGIGSYRIQPSEFAKISTALMLARYLAGANRRYLRLTQIAFAVLLVCVPMALVALSPDLGGAAMFLPMMGGMLVVAGIRWRFLVAGAITITLLGAGLWHFVMLDYQKDRVMTFMSPDRDPLGAGYQLQQSKIAVGSGQLTGRGYQQGTQSQLRFLPARHTDFIFAVLAEEWGFLGVVTVLGLYAVYIFNGARVAGRARDRGGVLLVAGLLSGFTFHVIYNTSMVVGLVPVTGIPLPFLSYGGSFTLANFIIAGLILGIDFRRFVNR